jgi:hypothetical protein
MSKGAKRKASRRRARNTAGSRLRIRNIRKRREGRKCSSHSNDVAPPDRCRPHPVRIQSRLNDSDGTSYTDIEVIASMDSDIRETVQLATTLEHSLRKDLRRLHQ